MSKNFQYACTNISLWYDDQKAIHLYQTNILDFNNPAMQCSNYTYTG